MAHRAASADSLSALREKIDELNHRLLKLLSDRAELVVQVGRVKHSGGEPIYQPVRESQVIEAMVAANQGPLSDENIRGIFTEVISACRALEHVVRIGFLGPEHTYSHEAALLRFGSAAEFVPLPSFAAVFQDLENGRIDFGVVAVENSTEGSINLTLDLLIETNATIIGEILLPVRHMLASREGDAANIERIVSHQQSLAQCRGYLTANFPNASLEGVASNALAAKLASEDPSLAAIASLSAAEAYGLRVIAESIQDVAHNTTRFLILGMRPIERSGHDKTSLLFAVPHKVGALNHALGVFARSRINVSKIESRPLRGRSWEYLFFVDVEGHREDARLKRALTSLKDKTLFLKVLGSYPEGRA